jgi:CheY-like chemotaxis protein
MQRRVLIVEDEPDTRALIRTLLELDGHVVEEAADGQAGIDRALEGWFDIALVDLGLPAVNGFQVARHLRNSPVGKRLSLVAITGNAFDRQESLDAGFDAHFYKPVDTEALFATVNDPPRAENRQI